MAFPRPIFVTVVSENRTFEPFTHLNFEDDFENATLYDLTGAGKLNVLVNKIEDTNQLQINFSDNTEVEKHLQ